MAKAKNWAIVVGINAYEHIGQLRYANRDAAALRNFFYEAKFDRVFCFADGLNIPPQSDQKSVQPRHSDLVDFLHDRFTTKTPPLSAGDNCWFFFAGHGKRIQDCDYLLPQDYNPRLSNHADRAIPVNFVREALLKSGADNVILLLDACRTEGDRADGLGIGDEQPGAITIFSCQRNQKAYEIEALQQGAFTAALLEGLRMPGERNCATVERLDLYLRDRVPQLCRTYRKFPEQIPTTIVEPRQKSHLILLPQYATSQDIAILKMEAYKTAQLDKNLDLAEHLWIRILAVAQGQDSDAIRALQAIAVQKAQSIASPLQSQRAPIQLTHGAIPLPEDRSMGSRSSPPPVRPFYRREEVRSLSPISTPVVQITPPVDSRPQRSIPWSNLAYLGFLYVGYGLHVRYGMLLGTISFPLGFMALFLVGALTGALAEDRALVVALAILGASSFAGILEWGAFAMILALAGTRAGKKLLAYFSRIHTFLILVSTSLVGAGVGYWGFKAVSGH